MFNKMFTDVCALFVPMIGLVMEQDTLDSLGAEKRALVVTRMEAILDEPGGLDWPKFLPGGGTRTWMIDFLVGQIVKVAKNTGFFGK